MESQNAKKYKNKVVLVTGSTMGIGLAMAEKFGLEEATVIICSRKQKNLENAANYLKSKGITVDAFVCNMNSKEDRKNLMTQIEQKYKKLDVLVCNVAVNPHFGPSYEIEENAFDKIFEVNVKNTFFTIKESLGLLKASKKASILIISSQAGYTPFNFIGVYSISKTALFSMTKLLAQELAKFRIRVNCIAPGIINTKMSQAIIDSAEAKNNFMGRAGVPHEISGAAVFLCSEDASFITGETVCINGGMHGRL